MTDRKSIALPQVKPHLGRRLLLHAYRLGVFILIIWLIRQQHIWYLAQQADRRQQAIELEQVHPLFPDAATLGDWNPTHGGQTVLDANGEALGYVILTSPQSDHVVGFSGPTNTLIALNPQHEIVGIKLLSSGDTPEHLQQVRDDSNFMRAFDGLTWHQAQANSQVDGVSGATLTSIAIVEGIIHRLGGDVPNIRFPDSLTADELEPLLPGSHTLKESADLPAWFDVLDASGRTIGFAMRTSPFADDVHGFQGPSDTLITFDVDRKLKGIAIRKSYDNQPYVRYVQEDEYFNQEVFTGRTLDELAILDLEEAEVEGVSGATETSMGVARGIVQAAKRMTELRDAPTTSIEAKSVPTISLSSRDIGTILVTLAAVLIAFTRLRKMRWLRLAFLLILFAYLGLINGDMVSQAMLVGWARSGPPWQISPGIVLLTIAALLAPIGSKRQLYCHHLCPHGAAQELLKKRIRWQLQLPRKLAALLSFIPALLLGGVVIVTMGHLQLSLVSIEPFDAYVIRIAGWATLTIAVVGLIASLFVPMAYCRFGCPTGAMLSFLRWRGVADRWSGRDVAALVMLVLAVLMWVRR